MLFTHIARLNILSSALPEGWKLNDENDNWPQKPIIDGLPYKLESSIYDSASYLLDIEAVKQQKVEVKPNGFYRHENVQNAYSELHQQKAELMTSNDKLRLENAELRKVLERVCKSVGEIEELLENTSGVTLLDSEIDWLARNRRFNGTRAVNRYAEGDGIETMSRVLHRPHYSRLYELKAEFVTDANYNAVAERRKQLHLIP